MLDGIPSPAFLDSMRPVRSRHITLTDMVLFALSTGEVRLSEEIKEANTYTQHVHYGPESTPFQAENVSGSVFAADLPVRLFKNFKEIITSISASDLNCNCFSAGDWSTPSARDKLDPVVVIRLFFFVHFCPAVTQGNDTVKDRLFRGSFLGVQAEIALAFKLESAISWCC